MTGTTPVVTVVATLVSQSRFAGTELSKEMKRAMMVIQLQMTAAALRVRLLKTGLFVHPGAGLVGPLFAATTTSTPVRSATHRVARVISIWTETLMMVSVTINVSVKRYQQDVVTQ
jgi:hypothetical protein